MKDVNGLEIHWISYMKFSEIKKEAPDTQGGYKKPAQFDPNDMGIKKGIKKVAGAAKANFQTGRNLAQVGAGKKDASVLGLIGAVKDAGSEIKGAAKGDYTAGQAEPVDGDLAQTKKDRPDQKFQKKQASDEQPQQQKAQPKKRDPKLVSDPIRGVDDYTNGAQFIHPENRLSYQYDATDKVWRPQTTDRSIKPIDQVKGKDFFNKDKNRTRMLEGMDARIQHIEDLIFFNGSAGAKRALDKIKAMAEKTDNVQIKWDGSPAVIFGRDENGEFVLTDKGGFVAKGYDGKAKSPEAVNKMFLARPGAKNDPKGFKALGANMAKAWPIMEKATPKNFKGYFKGDMLYFHEPQQEQNMYHFKPNIVQYTVKTDSDLGKKINKSKIGVVVHRVIDEDGNEQPFNDFDIMEGTDLLVIPPVTVSETVKVDESSIGKLENIISRNSSAIDSFLDKAKLKQMQVTDFPNILYTYVNQKVDSGLENLGRDFIKWLESSKVSANKQRKLQEYISENVNTFSAIWDTVNGIMNVKNNIIDQLNNQDADVKATINGQPGGEGYVVTGSKGDMKLVNRGKGGFTQANRSVQR